MIKKIIEDLKNNNTAVWDSLVISLVGLITFIFASLLHIYKHFAVWTIESGNFIFGEFFVVLIITSVGLIVFAVRRWNDLKSEITERQRVERKMLETTSQLKAVMDGVPDIIVQVDPELRILWANKEALKKNPDVKYRPAHKVFSYDEGAFLDASCKWSMELGRIEKNIMYQPDMIGVDGVSYWETIGVPLMHKDGRVYGAIGIARDITHRMRLEHTWNLLSSIVESTEDAIFGVSWEGTILNWNIGAEQTYGYQASEMVGKPISILEPLDRRNEVMNIIDKVMRKESVEKVETVRIKKGGKKIIISSTICPFVDATGKKIGISSIDRDITESKLAEEALKESEHFNKTIIASVGEGVVVYDKELRYKVWNTFMENITGVSAKEALGRKASDIFPYMKEEGIISMLEKALTGESVLSQGSMYHSEKDGREIWLLGSYTPHISARGEIIGVVGMIRDITERKEFEEALLESETFNKTIISSVKEGIFVTDTDLNFKVWNNFMEVMTGMNSNDVIGMHAGYIFSFLENIDMDEYLQKALAGETVIVDDAEYHIDDFEKTGWLSIGFSPHISATGEIIGIVGTVSEITSRKLSEEALKESETRFKELFDHMSSGVAVYHAVDKGNDFVFMDFNKAGEKIEKISKDKFIGERASLIFKKMKVHGLIDILRKVWKTGVPEYNVVTLRDENNKIISWRQNYIYRIFTGEVVSIYDDVTEKKSAEDALRNSEERYRTFVQNFKGIAFRWSPDYRPIFFHGSVEEITGYTEYEFVEEKLKWDEIIHPDDKNIILEQSDKIGIIPGYEEEFEYRIIRKDGEIRWVNEYLQNICDDSGKITYIQATIYNVTVRKVAEEELKSSREQLRDLAIHLETAREEERKDIAFEIHDELGYALTAIKLDLAWLMTKIGQEEAFMERMKAMTELVEMTINKVRSISSALRPSILDHFGLSAAIEWQAKEFQKRSSVRCKVDFYPKDIRLGDQISTTVFRIFQEALTNIARHAEATRVDVSLSKTKTEILLIVKDNGKGISKDELNSKKSLGLVGIREKAHALGGEVEISGSKGAGTKVLLVVPLNDGDN